MKRARGGPRRTARSGGRTIPVRLGYAVLRLFGRSPGDDRSGGDLYVVLSEDAKKRPPPVAFTSEEQARRHVRFLREQQEAAGDVPTGWRIASVRWDPAPVERPGAWVVSIDRNGVPVGPATFSLARRPDDPPREHDFRSDVEPIRGARDFVGYGRSRAEARESAEALRRRVMRESGG